jgi:uncharacterized DUF497 family protein
MVFADPERLDGPDRRQDYGEERRLAVGRVPTGETMLVV